MRYETKRNLEVRQIFKKRLNDKKVRERSLLESNPERRQLYDPLSYNYTRLTPTDAQAQLQYSQAFREATQYLGKQPDWNNSYAYQSSATEKGIVAMYPSEEYSTTFLAIDNPSAGNDTIGLLGQFVVQSNESTFITWSTPQGKPFAAQLQQWQHGPNEGWIGANEALVSGDINWGNSTCSPTYFANNDGGGENTPFFFGCLDCVMSLSNQSSCSDDCILPNGAFGIYTAKQCLATNSKDQYACLSVSLSGGDLAVQPLPYMIKISGELYLQNNCSETAQVGPVTVNFNYVCPPRTCPPGRAYYALEKPSNSSNYQLNPGKRELFSNFETWVYCSSFNETEKVNYISLPTTIDVNIMAGGEVTVGIEPLGAYSPNLNFHVYDASMYPDLHPYPALPSACGENDPNCTQLCARHPEANIPSDTMPAQYPEARPPSPAHRHKGLKGGVIAGIVIGGIGGGAALTAAAWCCYRKRGDCMQAMRSTRDIILELCGGRRPDQPIHPVSGPDVSPSPDMPIVPEQDPHPDDRWALIFGFTKAQAEVDEMFKPEPPTRPIKNSGRIPQAKGEASSSQAASESGPPEQNPSPDPWMSKFGFAQAQAAFNVEFKPESPTRPIKNSGRVPWEDKEASGVSSQPSGADSLLNPGQKRSDKS